MIGWLRWLLSAVLIVGVRFYQYCLRPVLPAVCRFQPSCSEYMILAVRKYGPLRGAWKGPAASAAATRGTPGATTSSAAIWLTRVGGNGWMRAIGVSAGQGRRRPGHGCR